MCTYAVHGHTQPRRRAHSTQSQATGHSHVKAFLAGLLQAAANGGGKRNVRTAQRGEVKTFCLRATAYLVVARVPYAIGTCTRASKSCQQSRGKEKKHLFLPCAWSGHVSASSPSRSNGSAPSAPAAASSLARVTRCPCTVTAPTAGRCSRRTARRARERRPMARVRRVSLWANF